MLHHSEGQSTDAKNLIAAFTGQYPRKDSAGKTYLPQVVSSSGDTGVTVEFVSDFSYGAGGFRCSYTTSLEESWVLNYEKSSLNSVLLTQNIAEDVCGGIFWESEVPDV